MTENLNPFLNVQKQIRKVCNMNENCSNNANKYELLSHPRRILKVNISL